MEFIKKRTSRKIPAGFSGSCFYAEEKKKERNDLQYLNERRNRHVRQRLGCGRNKAALILIRKAPLMRGWSSSWNGTGNKSTQ
jgi:hypothetical protein